jgi:hypothetical protein
LSILAGNADRESRLFIRAGESVDEQIHHRVAGLVRRIVQDTYVLNRILRERPAPDAAEAASSALSSAADAMTRRGQPDLGDLRGVSASAQVDALLTAPLHLLLQDLQRLAGLSAKLTST